MYFSQYLLTMTVICTSEHHFSEAAEKEEIVGCTGMVDDGIAKSGFRSLKEIYHDIEATKIPERFDARRKWPHCPTIGMVSNQGLCGGCWAFASASVMSDRICIATKGEFNRSISVQDLLECCTKCVPNATTMAGGCKGGMPYRAFEHWTEHGVVTGKKGCKPDDEGLEAGHASKQCRAKCTNKNYRASYSQDKWYATDWYLEPEPRKKSLKHIQIELMTYGPLLANMLTFDYLTKYNYSTVITFQQKLLKKNEKPGIHAIRIIGWDVVNGTPVWIFANTWGTNWCAKGFCYIKRGSNELQIESLYMAGGRPNLSRKPSSLSLQEIEISSSPSSLQEKKISSSLSVMLKCFFSDTVLGLLSFVMHNLV